jgi:hypothetical protein
METLKFIESLKDQSPDNIRTTFYKKGILSSYHPEDGRMVFYLSKNQRFNEEPKTTNLDLWRECNGLVIDTKNLNILTTPPESVRSNVDATTVNTNMSKDLYDIYLVDDGTLISMYYWKPLKSWRISTARSYDNTDSKWGSSTYSEIFRNLLAINNTTEQKFYDSLDKQSSYTFGFKHSSMHPFQEGSWSYINKLWFIQSAKNGVISNEFANDVLKIPNQTKYEFPEGVQQTTKYLFSKLNHSLDEFVNARTVLYGFILRTKNNKETGDHSNILLESSLLQKIRQLYYHSRFNEVAKEMKYDRDLYIVTYSYLNINSHSIFINLFPQYIPLYKKLDSITATLVNQVMTYANNPLSYNVKSPMYKTVRFIYESISNQCQIIPKDRRNVKLISSFLLSCNFTDLYYSLIFPGDTLDIM